MFETLTHQIGNLLNKLQGKASASEQLLTEVEQTLRDSLLSSDVHPIVVDAMIRDVRAELGESLTQVSLSTAERFIKGFERAVHNALGTARPLRRASSPPTVVMLVGLQGVGKTTTAGKLALWSKGQGYRPYLVPLDLKRPAAIEQLKVLGQRTGVPVYDTPLSGNPAKLAERAIKDARTAGCDLVILDTAGRLHLDADLMAEVRDIGKRTKPHEVLFVLDALSGQQALDTAAAFDQAASMTGIVLTKVEGDARPGAALSVRHYTDKPIKFLGTGEKLEAFEAFDPEQIVGRLLDRGDIGALLQKVEQQIDLEKMTAVGKKMMKAEMTLEDFRDQLAQLAKLGSIESLIGMMPGGKRLAQMGDLGEAQKKFVRVRAMIDSMTAFERRNPQMLGRSRLQRIAHGSGTSPSEIGKMLKDFQKMQKMMKRVGQMDPAQLQQLLGE